MAVSKKDAMLRWLCQSGKEKFECYFVLSQFPIVLVSLQFSGLHNDEYCRRPVTGPSQKSWGIL
jgi:hypothetical protein